MNIDDAVKFFVKLARDSVTETDELAEQAERESEAGDLLDEFGLSGEPS